MTNFYIATGSDFTRISPHGQDWVGETSLERKNPQALAVDPQDPQTVYAATYHHGLWKSVDGGRQWRDLKLPLPDVLSIAVSPVDGALYAGTEPSALFTSRDEGNTWQELEALKRIPSAPTWSFPPRPHTSHVRWIAPNPHIADLLLVGIELGGVMRTSDGGRTWQDHRPGAKLDAHELAWHTQTEGRAYQAAGDGAAWSHDYGQSWNSLSTSKSKTYTWALALHPDQPDTWFVSAAPSAYAAHHNRGEAQALIYRWRGEGPWEALNGLTKSRSIMPYSLQMQAGHLYVAFRDGEIWSSPDEGDSWQQIPLGTSQPRRITQMLVLD